MGSIAVDRSSLEGKVMVGYQGWFNCPDDGMDLGWKHWAKNKTKPSLPANCVVDLLPDVSEYDEDELHATDLAPTGEECVKVFSSANRKTVVRHFKWMREYGIHGAFLQRFGNGLHDKRHLKNKNTVLANAVDGAQQHGRTFVVMYDLSGMKAGTIVDTIQRDWEESIQNAGVLQSLNYQFHERKPLVAVWGVGFKNREYGLQELHALVQFFVDAGCSIMLGLPTGWRELNRDCVNDPIVHDIVKLADIVSPWTVGRYRYPHEVHKHAANCWTPDLQWCQQQGLEYMPVAFPGFSWHNLKQQSPLNQIPRLKGDFFWSQVIATHGVGCTMLYIAMFDEVDEGTAIFKCTNHVSPQTFCSFEGLPTDHYLKLAGSAAALFKQATQEGRNS